MTSADPRIAIVGGGVVVTEQIGRYVIDAGPDALLQQKPAAVALCGELGPPSCMATPHDCSALAKIRN